MPIKEAPRALGRATPPALRLSVLVSHRRGPEVFEMRRAKPRSTASRARKRDVAPVT